MNTSYKLNRKVTIQYNAQPERTDSNGNPWPDWQTLGNAWVEKTPISLSRIGRWIYQAAASQSLTDMIFVTHYREDIKPTMRIIDGVETYSLLVPPVDPDGRRIWMIIQGVLVLQNGG
jgi:SPP1 family predicted phage head-tail adaptor